MALGAHGKAQVCTHEGVEFCSGDIHWAGATSLPPVFAWVDQGPFGGLSKNRMRCWIGVPAADAAAMSKKRSTIAGIFLA